MTSPHQRPKPISRSPITNNRILSKTCSIKVVLLQAEMIQIREFPERRSSWNSSNFCMYPLYGFGMYKGVSFGWTFTIQEELELSLSLDLKGKWNQG